MDRVEGVRGGEAENYEKKRKNKKKERLEKRSGICRVLERKNIK